MCNNAAAPDIDLWIWEQTLENWNATIAVDVTAAILCTREVVKRFDAGPPFGCDPELLLHGGLQRDGPQNATTSPRRPPCVP